MPADHVLCKHVVEWKSRVFTRQWARCDPPKPGTFRLLPTGERLAAMARDDAQMRSMFTATPPDFYAVLAQLAEAEPTPNGSGTS